MAQLIITYWRDIPSQVTVKAGRKAEKKMLSERFQEAIDMAAMRSGAAETDDYLAEWRRSEPSGSGRRPGSRSRSRRQPAGNRN
jgi:hypothetical protein